MIAAPLPSAIKFLVGHRQGGRWSYAWRLGSSRTSFYIKPLQPALQGIKISLHGPDPRHGSGSRYHVTLDRSADGVVEAAGGVLTQRINWPEQRIFHGKEVHAGVDLVLRLRFTHDLFDDHAPLVPLPSPPKPRDVGALIPPPAPGYASDIDVFVCHREPFWPDEKQARLDNACLGPLVNAASQYLTAQAVHRRVAENPSPVNAQSPAPGAGAPAPEDDRIRGIGAAFDANEVLWIHETWLPRSGMHPSFSMFRPPTRPSGSS